MASEVKVEMAEKVEKVVKGQIETYLNQALRQYDLRRLVLSYEEQVLEYLNSADEAMYFPRDLSGYHRLLAHKVAQYHGLDTATVSLVTEESGKTAKGNGRIMATRPLEEDDTPVVNLADIPISSSEMDSGAEAPRLLKKKSGESRQRNPAHEREGSSGPPQRTVQERHVNYSRERDRIFAMQNQQGPLANGNMMRNASMNSDLDSSKAQFRNYEEESRDPDFQRHRMGMQMISPFQGHDGRFRPAQMSPDQAAQMVQNMSLQNEFAMGYNPHAAPGMVNGAFPNPNYLHAMQYMGYQMGAMMHQFPQGPGMPMYGNQAAPYGLAYGPPQQYGGQGFPQSPYPQAPAYGFMPGYNPRYNAGQQMTPGPQMAPGQYPFFSPYMGYQQMPATGRPGMPPQGRPLRPMPPNAAYPRRVNNGGPSAAKSSRAGSEAAGQSTAAGTARAPNGIPEAPKPKPEPAEDDGEAAIERPVAKEEENDKAVEDSENTQTEDNGAKEAVEPHENEVSAIAEGGKTETA